MIDQYKSYETCVDAVFVPEDKKIERLRAQIEAKLEEKTRMGASKEELDIYKRSLDEGMENYITDAKKNWWWSNEDGIKNTDETDPKKRRIHLLQERARVRKEKNLESKRKYEEYMNQTFQCPVCEKTIRGPQVAHVGTRGKYNAEEMEALKEGKLFLRDVKPIEIVPDCQTMMILRNKRVKEEIRVLILKRDCILEFSCDSLLCGCGCGVTHWDSKFHY